MEAMLAARRSLLDALQSQFNPQRLVDTLAAIQTSVPQRFVRTLLEASINPLFRVLKAIEHEKSLDEKYPMRKIKKVAKWSLH